MNNNKPPITLEEVKLLREKLNKIYFPDESETKRVVYDSKEVEQFLAIINSKRVGIPKGTPPKKIGITLEQWFEILSKNQAETMTAIPQYESQTTTTGLDLETKVEQFEKKNEQKQNIQAREKQTVEDFISKNEERIAKAKSVQDKLNNKIVYAKVVIPEPLPLDETEKKDLQTLYEYAQGSEDKKHKLIDDLTSQIETKLQNVPADQKELIARTAAVEIVEKLAKPEIQYETQIQTSILTAIHENKNEVLKTVLQKDDDLLTTAKNGSTLLELESKNKELTTKNIARNIFGSNLTLAIYGPEQFEIILSETKIEGQTTHEINLGKMNRGYIHELENQNSTLDTIKDFGIDKTQSFLTGQARTYLKEKISTAPAGGVLKKAYSDPIVQSIFARYGLASPIVWETVGQSQFVNIAMRFAPNTAGPILSFAGRITGVEYVTPVSLTAGGVIGANMVATQAATTYTSIAIKGGVFAAEAFAGGAGAATAGAVATAGAAEAGATAGAALGGGTPLSIVFAAIGTFIGWISGKLIEKFPQIKQWFEDNKGMLVGFGAGIGLIIGGPVIGSLALGLGLLATGSLRAFTIGAFNFFGAVGMLMGKAILAPIITTLLILPPLVAFIMVVINNSAYVVPPWFSDASNAPPIRSGIVSSCIESEETGPDITNQLASRIRNGVVNLLPNTVYGRSDGICIKPTMIIMHWSAGTNDNPNGNDRTYETLVSRKLSCQLATDTNDTWLMQPFYEKMVEFPACAGEWNTFSINNEMAGVYFTANPPPPNREELELAYDATCKIMAQYDIPWHQIYGHYNVPNNNGKTDPGRDFLEKVFIPEIERRCPNTNIR